MKTLMELYKSILSSVGCVVDNQGFVSTILPGSDSPKPLSVNSKRLVLPIDEQLRQTDWTNRIGFHPLQQIITGGESPVMEKFRDRMNGYSDFMLGMLMVDIAQLAVKKDMHKDLSPTQASYLGPFSDADEKFVKLITDLVATKRVSKKNFEFVRFSVIKGRFWQGQKRSRVAVMHFPLYDSLPRENKPTVILGFKLRVADVKMIRAMYEFLFAGIREQNHYEIGSDSKIAPSMESLMAVYAKFIGVLNNAVALLEPVIATSNQLLIVNDWETDLAQIEHYLPEIRKIPFLEGNNPTERVAQASAPQRINDTPIAAAPAKTVVSVNEAPVIPAASIPTHVKLGAPQQESQPVNQNEDQQRPRPKLGVRAPLVGHGDATHQISDDAARAALSTGLSYARPSATTLPPTPAVGAILAQERQVNQQPFGGQQQRFPGPGGNVLGTQAQAQPQAPQALKVPDTARIINGALYIPVENTGVAAIPAGAVLVDGKPYVPLQGAGAAATTATFNPQGRFGAQGPITDPGQLAHLLSPQEIEYYRTNPVMFQNYLAQLMGQAGQAAQQTMMSRQQAIPNYLQRAAQEAQQQQFSNRGFFPR